MQRAATTIQTIAKIDSEEPLYAEPYLRAAEVITALKDLLRTKSNKPVSTDLVFGQSFLFRFNRVLDDISETIFCKESLNYKIHKVLSKFFCETILLLKNGEEYEVAPLLQIRISFLFGIHYFQAIIKPTLGALFHISERRDGLESILKINDQTKGSLLIDIIQHIKFT